MFAMSTDAFALFNAILEGTEDAESGTAEEGVCPITGEKLDWQAVKLQCGHTFGYRALAKELRAQRARDKEGYGSASRCASWLCPYCRKEQSLLLPLNPVCAPCTEYGVNAPARLRMVPHSCTHVSRKGATCGKEAFQLCEGGPSLCKVHHLQRSSHLVKTSKEELIQKARSLGIDTESASFPGSKTGAALLILAAQVSKCTNLPPFSKVG